MHALQSVAGVQASTEPGHIQCYHECLLQRTGGTWAYTAFGLTLFTPAWSCVFSLTIYRIPACIAARQTSWNNCLHLYRSDLIGKVRSASSTHSKRQGCLTSSCDKHITSYLLIRTLPFWVTKKQLGQDGSGKVSCRSLATCLFQILGPMAWASQLVSLPMAMPPFGSVPWNFFMRCKGSWEPMWWVSARSSMPVSWMLKL